LFFDIRRFVGKAYWALTGLDDQAVFILGEGLRLVGKQLLKAAD
jgi:hypothetical protein